MLPYSNFQTNYGTNCQRKSINFLDKSVNLLINEYAIQFCIEFSEMLNFSKPLFCDKYVEKKFVYSMIDIN